MTAPTPPVTKCPSCGVIIATAVHLPQCPKLAHIRREQARARRLFGLDGDGR